MRSSAVKKLEYGWVDSPESRGTYDVVWTRFFTIFVCTFTVSHLNFPSPKDRPFQLFLRKVKWMVFTIVIPKMVTVSAFTQCIAARESIKAMRAIRVDNTKWTKRHAFYWNMPGVLLLLKDETVGFPINAAHQNYLIAEGILGTPELTSKEIWDKSKADKFAKLLACLQIGWLSTECLGRAIQGLPISLLEIATVGFAIPSLATFARWFSKPNNVDTPTVIRLNMTVSELLAKLGCTSKYVWQETPLDFIGRVNSPSLVSEVVLKSENWPARKRFEGASTRIRNDVFALKYSVPDQMFVVAVWIGYSGVHLAAWNFTFPSYAEKLLWRISCLVMIGSMFVFWMTGNRKFYLLFGYLRPSRRAQMEQISNERRKVSSIQIILGAVTGFSYVVARICLIIQALISLRAMPAGVFETINWLRILPHV